MLFKQAVLRGVHTALENQAADSSPRALLGGCSRRPRSLLHTGVLPAYRAVGVSEVGPREEHGQKNISFLRDFSLLVTEVSP